MIKEVTIEGEIYIVKHLQSANIRACGACVFYQNGAECPILHGSLICNRYNTILPDGKNLRDAYFVKKENNK